MSEVFRLLKAPENQTEFGAVIPAKAGIQPFKTMHELRALKYELTRGTSHD